MPGITLELAQTQLALYIAAEAKVLAGQSYEISGRKLTRADLRAIQEGITLWSARVAAASVAFRGRGRARTVVVGG